MSTVSKVSTFVRIILNPRLNSLTNVTFQLPDINQYLEMEMVVTWTLDPGHWLSVAACMMECSSKPCHHIFQAPNYSGIFETLHKILEKIFNLDRNEEIMQM